MFAVITGQLPIEPKQQLRKYITQMSAVVTSQLPNGPQNSPGKISNTESLI